MDSTSVLIIPVIAILILLSFAWHFGRSKSLLDKWAEGNDYRIIRQEYRTFIKGPFFWTSTRGQTVYYIIVEDRKGQRRSGWVRCGGWWLGLMSDHVEVRWDEAPPPPSEKGEDPLRDRWLDG